VIDSQIFHQILYFPVEIFISKKNSTFLKKITISGNKIISAKVQGYINVLQEDRLPEELLVSCLVANLPD
jgi:hypothetical protein